MDVFHRDGSPRMDREIWAAIWTVAVIDLVAAYTGQLNIAWPTFLTPIGISVAFVALGMFYRSIRKDRRAASLLICTAQLIAFTAVGAPLSYIAARAGFPLRDAEFAAIDHWLGIDWLGYAAFVTGRHCLQDILSVAYASFAVQTIATVFALGFTGQTIRLYIFLRAFILTTLVTIGISALVPAVGPWLFYDVQPDMVQGSMPVSSTSWPVFLGLRNGSFNVLLGLGAEGIITFPSLHAALAILFTAAVWSVHGLRWISLTTNSLMLVATPINGSHYVIDVISGIGIASLCWWVSAQGLKSLHVRAEIIPQIETSPSIAPDVASEVLSAKKPHVRGDLDATPTSS